MWRPSDIGVWFVFSCYCIGWLLSFGSMKKDPEIVCMMDLGFLLLTLVIKTVSYGFIDETIVAWIFFCAILFGLFLHFQKLQFLVQVNHNIVFFLILNLALTNKDTVGNAGPDILFGQQGILQFGVYSLAIR
jgi:hypothetical protein